MKSRQLFTLPKGTLFTWSFAPHSVFELVGEEFDDKDQTLQNCLVKEVLSLVKAPKELQVEGEPYIWLHKMNISPETQNFNPYAQVTVF